MGAPLSTPRAGPRPACGRDRDARAASRSAFLCAGSLSSLRSGALSSPYSSVGTLLAAAHPGLQKLFVGVRGPIRPSTLHGDLWSGNIASAEGAPVIFDPAAYYGHHEAEWGMSWCASLGPPFWEGYRELIPEDDGFDDRALLYELYHKLNHFNLFGGWYGADALGLMRQLARFGDEKLEGVAK